MSVQSSSWFIPEYFMPLLRGTNAVHLFRRQQFKAVCSVKWRLFRLRLGNKCLTSIRCTTAAIEANKDAQKLIKGTFILLYTGEYIFSVTTRTSHIQHTQSSYSRYVSLIPRRWLAEGGRPFLTLWIHFVILFTGLLSFGY